MPRSKGSQNNADGKKSSTKAKRKPSNSAGHDCSICRKSNMTLSGLKIHLLTHSGEKPFTCTECDKRFTCSSNLKKHQRIHSRDYIYKCDVCGKTCSDPSNMKKHMTVHSDEKAYTCPSCGKSYSYAQSLRQHMDDVHVGNGERRRKNKKKGHFPCPECGKVFGYYWRCSLHQARIHAVEKPYKCPECGKAFARETILNKHIQTHEKPFPCTVCDRRFSFRDQLRKHTRTHTGEKPYTCEQCFRSFTQRGSLTEHTRTHTGEKPFGCTNCGQKFSSSSSLKRHQRRVNACLSKNLGEEIPVDNKPRRVIYIGREPLNLVREGDIPTNLTSVFPIEESFTNFTEHFEQSTLTDVGRITMVPNLSNFQPIQNSYAAAASPGDCKVPFTQAERVSVVTSNFQPHIFTEVQGLVTMVSANGQRSLAVENVPISMANTDYQPSLYTSQPSIGMDAKGMQLLSPMMYPQATMITGDVKPHIMSDGTIGTMLPCEDIKPNVTLTTEGIKSLTSNVENSIPYSMCQPAITMTYPHLATSKDVNPLSLVNPPPQRKSYKHRDVVSQQIPRQYHSVIVNGDDERALENGEHGREWRKLVENREKPTELFIMVSSNSQPLLREYPGNTMVTQDIKPVMNYPAVDRLVLPAPLVCQENVPW